MLTGNTVYELQFRIKNRTVSCINMRSYSPGQDETFQHQPLDQSGQYVGNLLKQILCFKVLLQDGKQFIDTDYW